MARAHKIIADKRAIVVVAWGIYTGQELVDGVNDLVRHPHYDPDARVVVDLRYVNQYLVSDETLEWMGRGGFHTPKARKAFIVNSGFIGAVATMYGATHATELVAVFGADAPALEWLNESCAEHEKLTKADLKLRESAA